MLVGYITHVIKGSNEIHAEDGLSTKVSPTMLITRVPGPDYHQVKKLNFGDYVQMYDVKDKTSTNAPRNVGAIILYSYRNAQRGLSFISLLTEKRYIDINGQVYPQEAMCWIE